ncbi:MAG TPA: hypothetical protein VFA41_08160 [Ktedonobacteraceae bacterium]|nr:hypothetical protein [Ktedonobacteraceae bacterium]
MNKTRSPVILSAAKELLPRRTHRSAHEMLRCAQDDRWRQVYNGIF